MPTQPTGTPPYSSNATSRETATIARLYRAYEHVDEPELATAISEGLALILKLIEVRHRRESNGFYEQYGNDV